MGCSMTSAPRYRAQLPAAHPWAQPGLIRQGEWSFVPASDGAWMKSSSCATSRVAAENVWLCSPFPNGLTELEYKRTLADNRDAKRWGWEQRVLIRLGVPQGDALKLSYEHMRRSGGCLDGAYRFFELVYEPSFPEVRLWERPLKSDRCRPQVSPSQPAPSKRSFARY